MKSAYELALERLNKNAPAVRLTSAQKQEIADIESRYAARIAEREITLQAEMNKVAGDLDAVDALRRQLAAERTKLQSELADKKEAVRGSR
jgi:molybdopterin converting factor small subunit